MWREEHVGTVTVAGVAGVRMRSGLALLVGSKKVNKPGLKFSILIISLSLMPKRYFCTSF